MNSKKKTRQTSAKTPSKGSAIRSRFLGTEGNFTLHSRTIRALPIINRFMDRCRLRETLDKFLPPEDGRNRISTATAILLMVRNILISRQPVYGVGEWAASDGCRLLWIHSWAKEISDDAGRMKAIKKATDELTKLRASMVNSEVESLPLYHEGRSCRCPTTRRVIEAMEPISRHRLEATRSEVQDLYTDLTPRQSQLIKLFGLAESTYGKKK